MVGIEGWYRRSVLKVGGALLTDPTQKLVRLLSGLFVLLCFDMQHQVQKSISPVFIFMAGQKLQ